MTVLLCYFRYIFIATLQNRGKNSLFLVGIEFFFHFDKKKKKLIKKSKQALFFLFILLEIKVYMLCCYVYILYSIYQ